MTKFLNISTDTTLGGNAPSDELAVSQKAIKTYVDSHGGGVSVDGLTITRNSDQEIQTVAVIDQNTGIIKPWSGTGAEYEDISEIDPDTLYFTDDLGAPANVFRREVSERNMGEIVYSTVPITDSGLHLADGEALDGAGIYADFYNYMVGVYNDGHTSIFCSEADWQTEVANKGVCGKYVLDTSNQTIRLPKAEGWAEGITNEANAGANSAGLPNITGDFAKDETEYHRLPIYNASGCFTNAGSGTISTHDVDGGWNGGRLNGVKIDASRSSAVYGRSNEVTPRGVKVLVYIVLANTAKVPVQVDIDNIATQLNLLTNKTNDMYGHRVVEFQQPTSTNGYTWYRKYADGWVEQGGWRNNTGGTITFPIAMSLTNQYTAILVHNGNTAKGEGFVHCYNKTSTSMSYGLSYSTDGMAYVSWQVSGMAA